MKVKLFLFSLLPFLSLANIILFSQQKIIVPPPVDALSNYQHPSIPKLTSNNLPILLRSPNYIVVDSATNTILLAQNSHQKIFPASITKLATALTALNVYPLDELITVKQAYTEGKVMELKIGEKITVQSLVSALLVYSANDAAFTLANHHTGGIDGFINQMNLLAQKYQLTDTHFVNYDGIHHPEHFSTVYDLSQLGRLALKNPIVKQTVKQKNLTVTDIDNTISHQLSSTNELLGLVPEIEGIKTGWTPEAGGCFISLLNLDGHYLISVVAQSEDRFADTLKILNWAKRNIIWSDYQP